MELERDEIKQKYAVLSELAPEVIYSVDTQGKILSLSPTFEKLSGWKVSEWVGKNFTEMIHPDDLPLAEERFRTGLKRRLPPYELRVRTKSGVYKIGEFHNQKNVQIGKVVGKIGVVRDVTEHKTLNTELKTRIRQQAVIAELGQMALQGVKLERLFARAIERLKDELRIEYSEIMEAAGNRLVVRAKYGWGRDVQVNKTSFPIDGSSQVGITYILRKPILVSDLANEKRFTPSLFARKYHSISEMSVLIYGGKDPFGVLAVHTKQKRIFNLDDQDFLQTIASIIALTIQRRKIEGEILQREGFFRSITEYSLDGIRLVNEKGKVLYVTPSIQKILGYSKEEYQSMSVFEIMHPDDTSVYTNVFNQCIAHPSKPYKLIYRLRHKDGTWRWIEGVGRSLLHVPGVNAIVSNFHDISQQVEMSRALESLNERLQIAVSLAQMARWSIDLDTGVLEMDAQSRQILDIPLSIKLSVNILAEYVIPEDRARLLRARSTAIKNHNRMDIEYRLRNNNGAIKWVHVVGKAVYEGKRPTRFDAVGLDITSSKEKDERKDEFISTASHELKTPITSLQLFVQLLERQTASDQKMTDAVQKVKSQTDRIKEIINDLLDVSRIETGKMKLNKEKFYLDELIDDTLEGLGDTVIRHRLAF